jgi:hypothetical protein
LRGEEGAEQYTNKEIRRYYLVYQLNLLFFDVYGELYAYFFGFCFLIVFV